MSFYLFLLTENFFIQKNTKNLLFKESKINLCITYRKDNLIVTNPRIFHHRGPRLKKEKKIFFHEANNKEWKKKKKKRKKVKRLPQKSSVFNYDSTLSGIRRTRIANKICIRAGMRGIKGETSDK